MEIRIFRTANNKCLFQDWVDDLPSSIRLKIYQRFSRIEEGNFGDFKNLKGELYELRFHFNSGLRVYYTKQNNKIIILLCGGDKKTQKKDIIMARKFLEQIKEGYGIYGL